MTGEAREPNTTLSCEHKVLFDPPPSQHDIVWCWYCGRYRKVFGGKLRKKKAGDSKEYRYIAVCDDTACVFVRKGMDLKTVEIQGDSHSIRTGHEVTVSDPGGKAVTRISPIRILRSSVIEP
jgi:hypothetical protein